MTTARPQAATAARSGYLKPLDGWRGIAATMVLVTHVAFATGFVVTGGALGALAARMDFGVAIFFLLSGFLLYRPWVRVAASTPVGPSTDTPESLAEPVDLRRYALRRTARVVPGYLLALVVIFAFLPEADPSPADWLTNLTFTQIYGEGHLVRGFTQTWSIATEVSFYLVLPLLGWLGWRLNRRDPLRGHASLVLTASAGGLAFVLARAAGIVTASSAGSWLPNFLLWFGLGMGCALLREARAVGRFAAVTGPAQRLAGESAACLVTGGLLLVLLATPLAGPYALESTTPLAIVVKHVGYGLAALLLLLPTFLADPAAPPSLHARALSSGPLRWLGEVSYGVFLWHVGVISALLHLVGGEYFSGGFLLLLTATLVVTAVIASISWHLVESPILRWAHRQ